jgi:hypothetical protein
MKLAELSQVFSPLSEGRMKRSDPIISGERSPGSLLTLKDAGRAAPAPRKPPGNSGFDTKIKNLARAANVSPETVEKLWDEQKKRFDRKNLKYWALVMAGVQRELGLRKSLSEGEIQDETGYAEWSWKPDLEEEEHEGYLPAGYDPKKVLEFSVLSMKEPGQGHGSAMMKKFLASKEAQEAELIFGDPCPHFDANESSPKSDEELMKEIQKFLRRFGFRNRPGAWRMWLVKKGSIPDSQLPT